MDHHQLDRRNYLLTGGVSVSEYFNTSGPNFLTLATVITNAGGNINLGGAGTLAMLAGAGVSNVAGTLTLSEPTITSPGGAAGITNSALGEMDIPALLGTPVTIGVPFTNDGTLNVGSGSTLALTTPTGPGGTPNIDLSGTVQLDGGILNLLTSATAQTGLILANMSGFLEVGDASGSTPGTLIVPAGVTDQIEGNLEINTGSTLTGGGTLSNSGRLQLDVGSSTAGLANYEQGNSGTLAELVTGNTYFTPLTVVNTASLSGTLVLPGYTGVVGDSFTVVYAGNVVEEFDMIPDGMTQSETATTATVTQVKPPAGS